MYTRNDLLPLENDTLEYKRDFSERLKREIGAFLNGTQTGYIYLGIDDQTRQVVHEFSPEERHRIEETISRWVSGGVFYPSAIGLVRVHVNHDLLVVSVTPGGHQPYLIDQQVFLRNNSESVRASVDAMQRIWSNRNWGVYDAAESEQQDLHFHYLQNAFDAKGIEFRPQALGFLTSEARFTNTALLMSDENPTIVKLSVFDGTTVMRFKNHRDVTGSLVKQLDEALLYAEIANPIKSIITGRPQRIDLPAYPNVALREALINAISHRSFYSRMSVQVEFFDDRASVSSPGSLPITLPLAAIYDGQSLPRNPKVVAVLHRLGYIENYGTGIRRILDSYDGCAVQPSFQPHEDYVKWVFPNRNYQVTTVDFPVDQTDDDPQLAIILNYLSTHDNITRVIVEKLLGIKEAQARNLLARWSRNDALVKSGSGRSTSYTLKRGNKK